MSGNRNTGDISAGDKGPSHHSIKSFIELATRQKKTSLTKGTVLSKCIHAVNAIKLFSSQKVPVK
jgi:hypothetical protein